MAMREKFDDFYFQVHQYASGREQIGLTAATK
jgi:hypothetical protein